MALRACAAMFGRGCLVSAGGIAGTERVCCKDKFENSGRIRGLVGGTSGTMSGTLYVPATSSTSPWVRREEILDGQRMESGTLLELRVERWMLFGREDESLAGVGGTFRFWGGILAGFGTESLDGVVVEICLVAASGLTVSLCKQHGGGTS